MSFLQLYRQNNSLLSRCNDREFLSSEQHLALRFRAHFLLNLIQALWVNTTFAPSADHFEKSLSKPAIIFIKVDLPAPLTQRRLFLHQVKSLGEYFQSIFYHLGRFLKHPAYDKRIDSRHCLLHYLQLRQTIRSIS